MRPTTSIRSPAPLAYWLRYVSREFTLGRHVQPPPAKKPLRCCQVRPRSTCTGDFTSNENPDGRNEPSSARSCVLVFSVLFEYASPLSSAVKRSDLREGKPAPRPQRKPLVVSTSSVSVRKMNPPDPANSTRWFMSLLTTASIARSILPVLAPLSLSPVGSFAMKRSAAAAAFCCRSDMRFHLAPTQKSPMLLPLQAVRASGFCGTTAP